MAATTLSTAKYYWLELDDTLQFIASSSHSFSRLFFKSLIGPFEGPSTVFSQVILEDPLTLRRTSIANDPTSEVPSSAKHLVTAAELACL